ncbi:hypothetical protein PVAG01_03255 [Phlyctema vagabunda]|uniref:Asl1-like glycosyl hydrolase catalytic domain-containing protein n=1 Tax=Phlyctema vagabunda TaxID=108571 RepID=A0ABR4PSY2_9HELO
MKNIYMAALFAIPSIVIAQNASYSTRSSKRGLVYVPSSDNPTDDDIWTKNGSDLTWYYNYQYYPSASFINDTSLEFIPMLWGAPSSTDDTTFRTNVTEQILGGANITYAMGFNEPDGTNAYGGSNVDPDLAAEIWIRELEPLRKLGVTLGAPAVTGGSEGWAWLQKFFTACAGQCTAEFIPVHWYGNFDGLSSHIEDIESVYSNMTIWVTEYALNNASLTETQEFFKTSAEYFDSHDNISHYSYFGSFRSDVSNVGANVAMLTSDGLLTDIGSWYLGGTDTGNIPSSEPATKTAATSSRTSATTVPTTTWTIPTSAAISTTAQQNHGILGATGFLFLFELLSWFYMSI